jgi:hypothetical protein
MGLTKVSPGPAMPYPSMPCGQGETPAAVFYLFRHPPRPYASDEFPAHESLAFFQYGKKEISLASCLAYSGERQLCAWLCQPGPLFRFHGELSLLYAKE